MTTTAISNNHHLACSKEDHIAPVRALSLDTACCLHSNQGLDRDRGNSRLMKAMRERHSADQQHHHQAGEM